MTIIGAAVIASSAATTPISELADMVSIGALSAMIIVAIAVPVLRRTPPGPRGTVPGAALAGGARGRRGGLLHLMSNLDLLGWLRFAVWLAIGPVICLANGRRHSVLNRAG